MKSPHPTRMTVLEHSKKVNRRFALFNLAVGAASLFGAVYQAMEYHDSVGAGIGAATAFVFGGLALFREMDAGRYQTELLAYGRPNHPGQPRTGAAG